MDKKDLRGLKRKDLVDALYDLTENGEEAKARMPVPEEIAEERRKLRRRARTARKLITTLGILTVVAAVAVLLSVFVFPVIQVSGDSMEPTLADGDVLVLLNTDRYTGGELCCVAWQNKLLIKRVIALSGDSVDIDEEGNVFVNGRLLDEPYVTDKSLGECDIEFPYLVPEGKVFVMGDRRESSIDSRSSAIGPVGGDQIVGKVLFRVWPLGSTK
ncbi:signal peptidase I [Ruminococcaceae bacterium YRB3002]|nr:signal peptidase I [Ruminococcaceae bacterium YRB3002]